MKDTDKNTRIKLEAEFQDTREMQKRKESRTKFYFLTERAEREYYRFLNGSEKKRILVVGCAKDTVAPLARMGHDVTGIDVSQVAINKLNKAISEEGLRNNAKAYVMDAENLDFSKESFDVLCCSGVLHHLDIKKALESWGPILTREGELVMLEPMKWNPFAAIYRVFTPSQRTKFEHPLVPNDLKIIRKYFSQVNMRAFAFLSPLSIIWVFLPNFFNLKDKTCRLLERVDEFLFKRLSFLRYLGWTALIHCKFPQK